MDWQHTAAKPLRSTGTGDTLAAVDGSHDAQQWLVDASGATAAAVASAVIDAPIACNVAAIDAAWHVAAIDVACYVAAIGLAWNAAAIDVAWNAVASINVAADDTVAWHAVASNLAATDADIAGYAATTVFRLEALNVTIAKTDGADAALASINVAADDTVAATISICQPKYGIQHKLGPRTALALAIAATSVD